MEKSRRQGNRKTILVRWRSVVDLAKSVTQHLGSLKPVSFNISYTRSQTSSTIGLKTSLGQTRQTRQTRLVRTNETSRTNETRSNKVTFPVADLDRKSKYPLSNKRASLKMGSLPSNKRISLRTNESQTRVVFIWVNNSSKEEEKKKDTKKGREDGEAGRVVYLSL